MSQMFPKLPTGRFTRQFARLNNIANFPNSAVRVPATVNRLELVLKQNVQQGHMGLHQFKKWNLPTIQFHNPELCIVVKRVKVESKDEALKVPASLVINYTDGTSKTFDCKNKRSEDIMTQFIDLTGAEKVPDSEIPVWGRK
ncbi:54S ribosomal protein, mitochondrial [Komagataella phaffii CBS 7435]|uniref:Ribosomal protein/NADH dehydrogenase domain-containing protein n=2 Tax=Komagataella phaffii TaxID=460519 RepID=C4R633_KOMPG|nr:Hypothetical protein PAS_chr3_0958 [Komagataella phaffii GS115]AOA63936.1 GQ67_04086T0 [Komagataella phaffii]CAH2449159.1 54S ribosomal protein, mitochondrial [Komagataella phaffii CBS 7435]AOA68227.1 GQ68_04059T0 [Komagataella phaffii GS115]CAY71019.1 Hypothetical protein PAS_chr3_0958 [Komagataella phaffii GS115]CCA39185.1 54S ribosomal protein, mitochondrial [Komagataella phaffii CBS 7435]